jgi:hypothetical protein
VSKIDESEPNTLEGDSAVINCYKAEAKQKKQKNS